ncbi:hypothetical protein A3I57_00110 [Candidatus Beckwithbacteria bacterium RIFCSPLOWO2_02_FULL_47_23]|uniref:Glycosyltransferase RgtA/B/C/D-like domain-containing protein n=2 Tax=Candidatus Beckwithiibacteriota TaxID=1752726 RepID=A0A1F5E201_9BACT|nr:MAG: hypothetical protein A3E73_02440 [Candidatus Beckwithbacteria bacterium RIFCSPHIGHO2_12_FULL_47_17]OGD61320.1 MAG: hypothetical protein A3I57_00110 [Candidatus Beckwithbacteria bacterium RIFCSPLOWO2_02_FULL_47_23]
MKTKYWWLIGILGLALFLRWWHLEDWFHFTMDEELIAWRAWGLFELRRPFLIGGISPLQIHLPPYFYYWSSLLLWPFKFDPVGWGFWAGLFSLITIWLLYKLSRNLIAPLLYSVSLTTVMFDRHYWPLFFNPLFTLLTFWSLKKKQSFVLILTLTAAVTADPSNLVLVIFVLLSNFRLFLKKAWIGAVIFLVPLLLFDLRHQWQNLSGVSRLFGQLGANEPNWGGLLLLPQSLARFWYTAQTNLIEVYSYCIPFAQARLSGINIWLLLAAVITIILAVWRQREIKLLLLSYFVGLSVFGLLGFSLFDHYLTGLMPVWAMVTAAVIKHLPKKLAWLLVGVFVAVNLFEFSRVDNPYGLEHKKDLIKWANLYLIGSDWELQSESKCHRENGLRYLFELSGNPPVQSFMDPNFSWLYPTMPSDEPVDKTLLTSDRPLVGNEEVVARESFGAMGAYILRP